jgi:enoyl-CoA hydratase/carnithine racemase
MADVVIERRGDATWIKLNRPDRKNAYDFKMCAEIISSIKEAERGDSVALVITGSGDSFCAGGFLKQLANPDPIELRSMFFGSLELFDAIRNAPVPVIAAVNGVAAGGYCRTHGQIWPDRGSDWQRTGIGGDEPAGNLRG